MILGRDAKNVTEAEAFDYVFGYTIVNDVSARNLQTGHKQWYFGKGLGGFTPMGPCIVTKEAFPQPPAQAIRTWVNGQLRQEAVTDQLIFSIPHILRELSQGMTLQAGTIIATGTPAGGGWALIRPGSCGRGMWSAVRLRALVFWKTLWKDNRNQTASGLAPLAVSLVSQETLLPQGREQILGQQVVQCLLQLGLSLLHPRQEGGEILVQFLLLLHGQIGRVLQKGQGWRGCETVPRARPDGGFAGPRPGRHGTGRTDR